MVNAPTLREFHNMSDEQKKTMADEALWGSTKKAVTEIARNRRMAELTHGISTEEFDEKLNELCAEANSKYCSMTDEDMTKDVLMELISAGGLKDLIEHILG